jgi:hypothetical protein
MNEDKRDRSPAGRFKYLADKRVSRAISAIQSVGNLSERKNYEYSDDQVKQITDALTDAVQQVMDDFARNQRQRKNNFQLK